VSIFTVAGVAMVGAGNKFDFTVSAEKADAGLIARLGKHSQPVKASGKLMVDLNSVASGSTRVSHMNVSAFTIAGTDRLAILKSFSISGTFDKVAQAGVGEKYAKPQVVAKDYQVSIELDVTTGVVKAMMDKLTGSDFTGHATTVSITLNGVTLTFAMNLNEGTLSSQRYSLQSLQLSFDGADPGAGNYPAAPTGATTILEKALNAATTEMAFSFQNAQSADSGGIAASGNVVFDSFSIKIADGQLVEESYGFETYGTITIAASS
jgi:hypothetical protein